MKRFVLFLGFMGLFLLYTKDSESQNIGVGINPTGSAANPKALLDVDATGMNPKTGLLVPRMSIAERNAITAPIPESLLIYNTSSHCFESYYNGGWVAFGCLSQGSSIFICGNTLTDSRDGQAYSTVQIGTQCWMGQNLNYGTFTSVSNTPQQTGYKFCENLSMDGNDDPTCPVGAIYEWTSAMNVSISYNSINSPYFGTTNESCNPCGPTTGHGGVQGLCPAGWHIPSHYEWSQFEQAVCAISPAGTDCAASFPFDVTTTGLQGTNEGDKLKYTPLWFMLCILPGPINASGFQAAAEGYSSGGSFDAGDQNAFWWSTTEADGSDAWDRYVWCLYTSLGRDHQSKTSGYSVRCVQDR